MSPHVLAALSTDDIHTSVLYVFSLVRGAPRWWPRSAETYDICNNNNNNKNKHMQNDCTCTLFDSLMNWTIVTLVCWRKSLHISTSILGFERLVYNCLQEETKQLKPKKSHFLQNFSRLAVIDETVPWQNKTPFPSKSPFTDCHHLFSSDERPNSTSNRLRSFSSKSVPIPFH